MSFLGRAPTKYANVSTWVGEERFDSKAEARRWQQLRILEQQGHISNLIRQPRYQLEPKAVIGGVKYRSVTYVADFEYLENGRRCAEDVKGGAATQTALFQLKARLFRARYPDHELRIVT